ncbi:hypothetical protein ACFRFU_50330 [Streptomyces sp. NPDC056704]|uniref:hypothetical protein n=1 Tax=Streptomyces TaxID=1883 RepID=UPI0036CA5B5D
MTTADPVLGIPSIIAADTARNAAVSAIDWQIVSTSIRSTFSWPAFASLTAALGDRLAWGATHVVLALVLAVVPRLTPSC